MHQGAQDRHPCRGAFYQSLIRQEADARVDLMRHYHSGFFFDGIPSVNSQHCPRGNMQYTPLLQSRPGVAIDGYQFPESAVLPARVHECIHVGADNFEYRDPGCRVSPAVAGVKCQVSS